MMGSSRSYAFVLAALLVTAHAAAQTSPVSIQFQNGNVTVRTTTRMPLRTVLQEWARVGRARFVNAEGVTGTLEQTELVDVPEQQALAILLREVSGYAVGARELASSGPSRFDRIMLLPRSAAVAPGPRVTSVVPNTPPPPPIAFVPGDTDDDPNDVAPNAGRGLTPQQLQNQITNAQALAAARAAAQQNQNAAAQQNPNSDPNAPAQPQRPGPAVNTPTNPFYSGTAGRPGVVVPVPQQPRNPLRPNGDPEP